MTYEELVSRLDKKEVEISYLFSGGEEFRKENVLHKLKEILQEGKGWEDFNYNLFYAHQTSGKEIATCAQTLPFMAKRRMIVVKDAEKFTLEDEKHILSYLKAPSYNTCLIFLVYDVKKRFFKEISKFVEHIIFYSPFENQISAWIKKEVSQYNKSISESACLYLKEEVGNSLINLHNEIEKLAVYVKDKREIELEDVQFLVGHTKVDNVFQLLDELGKKRGKKALKIIKNLIEKGEEPVKVLVMVVRYIRNLIKAKLLLKKGNTYEEIRISLGAKKYPFREFIKQVNNFSYEELKEDFHLLLLADREIKTGKKNASLVLELLILKLTCQVPR